MLPKFGYVLASAAILAHAVASSDVVVSRSDASPKVVRDIRQRLNTLARDNKREFSNSTSLDKSFDGAVLFKM